MLERGRVPAKSAILTQRLIITSVMSAVISDKGVIKDRANVRYPNAIINGTNGMATMFAISAVIGILPKEKHRVIMVNICADSVTARAFGIKGIFIKDRMPDNGLAYIKIPKTAENESIKLNEKAVKGLKINIANAANAMDVIAS